MKKILVILAAAMMATTGAFAKQECKEDRAKFCASVEKGNHQAMHQCMKSHEGELSASCKSHRDTIREKGKGLKRHARPTTRSSASRSSLARVASLNACAKTKPNSAPIVNPH
jgi:hypothetical protein